MLPGRVKAVLEEKAGPGKNISLARMSRLTPTPAAGENPRAGGQNQAGFQRTRPRPGPAANATRAAVSRVMVWKRSVRKPRKISVSQNSSPMKPQATRDSSRAASKASGFCRQNSATWASACTATLEPVQSFSLRESRCQQPGKPGNWPGSVPQGEHEAAGGDIPAMTSSAA